MNNELVIYQSETLTNQIEVRIKEDTLWLNRQQISLLFDRDVKTIGKHINNASKEELKDISVIAKFATTAADGKNYKTKIFILDVIISVGYSVKAKTENVFLNLYQSRQMRLSK